MRLLALVAPFSGLVVFGSSGCGLEQLTQTGKNTSTGTDAGTSDAASTAPVGAGCGVDSNSRQELCAAVSTCPNVVVDQSALPHCGFRIRGTASELVCACGESVCSMGAFSTCNQAAALLQSQTEANVCMQVAEGRCSTAPTTTPTNPTSTCDRQCLQECGQGGGCASICGC